MAVIRDREVNEPMIPLARGSTYHAFQQGVDQSNYGGKAAVGAGATA